MDDLPELRGMLLFNFNNLSTTTVKVILASSKNGVQSLSRYTVAGHESGRQLGFTQESRLNLAQGNQDTVALSFDGNRR